MGKIPNVYHNCRLFKPYMTKMVLLPPVQGCHTHPHCWEVRIFGIDSFHSNNKSMRIILCNKWVKFDMDLPLHQFSFLYQEHIWTSHVMKDRRIKGQREKPHQQPLDRPDSAHVLANWLGGDSLIRSLMLHRWHTIITMSVLSVMQTYMDFFFFFFFFMKCNVWLFDYWEYQLVFLCEQGQRAGTARPVSGPLSGPWGSLSSLWGPLSGPAKSVGFTIVQEKVLVLARGDKWPKKPKLELSYTHVRGDSWAYLRLITLNN
jgi:hypothetical protein